MMAFIAYAVAWVSCAAVAIAMDKWWVILFPLLLRLKVTEREHDD